MSKFVFGPLLLGAAITLAACGGDKPAEAPAAPAAPAPAPAAEPVAAAAPATATPEDAKKLFGERCAVCHGDTGAGDGVGAASLNPKPRNFGDAAWQDSVTDEQLIAVIVGGGAAVGKSAIMPPQPDLKAKQALLDELVKHIRTLKK